jgi:hypothetical protein
MIRLNNLVGNVYSNYLESQNQYSGKLTMQ